MRRLTNEQRSVILLLSDKRWTSISGIFSQLEGLSLTDLWCMKLETIVEVKWKECTSQWRLSWLGQAAKMRLKAEGWVLE